MKKIIFSVALLFINIFPLLSKDADTVIITVNDLFETRKIVFEVREGQVILFKMKDEERFNQTKISFKFWREKNKGEEPTHQLHSKGAIVFGKKTANEDKYIVSPVTGRLEVRLKRYGLTIGIITAGTILVISKIVFF